MELHLMALYYKHLIKYEIHVSSILKNEVVTNVFCFEPENFHHLSGLQHLKDIPNISNPRDVTEVFKNW